MSGFNSRLFSRIIAKNREVYVLKIVTLAIAFASSVLILLFSLHEFGYDRFHRDAESVFRVVQRSSEEDHIGNRLSVKIPKVIADDIRSVSEDSLITSRVKSMHEITIKSGEKMHQDQIIYAADSTISKIFTFEILEGSLDNFSSRNATMIMSSSAAERYTGSVQAVGKKLRMYTFGDTVDVVVAAVYKDFPENSHELFDIFISFNSAAIKELEFSPDEISLYGKILKGDAQLYESSLNKESSITELTYKFQALPDIYFGNRVLGEDAHHGDSYSIIILICIAGLILFLALTSFINLTTLTLPYRSKEIAVKKLAGISQEKLVFSFLKESFALVGLSLGIGIIILVLTSDLVHPILGIQIAPLLLKADIKLIMIVAGLFLLLSVSPVLMTFRFVRATPNRLLSTDTITFPRFKRVITFLQLGISIFLIVASVVIRRQINYSLLKEPGRNHDQVVYLDCPDDLTNAGLSRLRKGWRESNANIVDVMAVSQLPDRINSREIGTGFYSLLVDPGFANFFNLRMTRGNWFRASALESFIVVNQKGLTMLGPDTTKVIGALNDLSGEYNQPEKPMKIRLAPDFNYNFLCVRILEVDIRRTVDFLSHSFAKDGKNASVHFLNKRFDEWLTYQDRLNVLSEILAVISALLSCCAIYGLSVSLVRDKLKQIAVHKLYGARIAHITRMLIKEFVRQMMVAILIFGPFTYIFLKELLRNFVYVTKFDWMDPVYPIAYCTFIITILCGFQALSLNRSDLTSALKG